MFSLTITIYLLMYFNYLFNNFNIVHFILFRKLYYSNPKNMNNNKYYYQRFTLQKFLKNFSACQVFGIGRLRPPLTLPMDVELIKSAGSSTLNFCWWRHNSKKSIFLRAVIETWFSPIYWKWKWFFNTVDFNI